MTLRRLRRALPVDELPAATGAGLRALSESLRTKLVCGARPEVSELFCFVRHLMKGDCLGSRLS